MCGHMRTHTQSKTKTFGTQQLVGPRSVGKHTRLRIYPHLYILLPWFPVYQASLLKGLCVWDQIQMKTELVNLGL